MSSAAFDPGCVKTPQAEKQGEWTFSDQSKIDHASGEFRRRNEVSCARANWDAHRRLVRIGLKSDEIAHKVQQGLQ
jgi:hypothetical protein